MKILRVRHWEKSFESGKSKDYNLKSQTYMPNKFGLGYYRIMRDKSGPAIYGAWCALVCLLSQKTKPRKGYLTDNGRCCGVPYTSEDLSGLLRIKQPVIDEMVKVCTSQSVGWLEFVSVTAPDPEPMSDYSPPTVSPPLPSPPPPPSPLPLPSPINTPEGVESNPVKSSFGEFNRVKLTDEERSKLVTANGEARTAAGIEILDAWLERTGKRRKSHYACLKSDSWVWEKVGGNGTKPTEREMDHTGRYIDE